MINAYLVGDAEVIRKLTAIPPRLREELKVGIGRLAIRLQKNVQTAKLRGEVLKVRTGRLWRSIHEDVIADNDRVSGIVSTAVRYGIAWELGFDRKVGAGARGGPRALMGAARERYILKHPPGVKHFPARSFLRTALREMQEAGIIRQEMEAAVRRATK